LLGYLTFFSGWLFNTTRCVSIHSFCFSVSSVFPPSKSFYRLKLLMTTPTKRFSRKKEPTTMKAMKKSTQ
jgi:hypothetical protein